MIVFSALGVPRKTRSRRLLFLCHDPLFRSLVIRSLVLGLVLLNLVPAMGHAVAQMQPFTQEAAARGIDFITYGSGTGIACDDLDGDGDPDFIATVNILGQVAVFENDGSGNFTDRTVGSGLPVDPLIKGVSLADYDGDGDRDVYISSRNGNYLMRNNGGFSFSFMVTSGTRDEGPGRGSCWADVDGDGWLDLYLCNHDLGTPSNPATYPNKLFRNLGNGTFEDVTDLHGVGDVWLSFQAIFFDPDHDGDPDLYLSNDRGHSVPTYHNRMWKNVAGQLVEISDTCGATTPINSMGLDFGDLNGDGHGDLFCTDTQGQMVYLGNSPFHYSAAADVVGTAGFPGVSWGVNMFDFDNDMHLEAYVAVAGANSVLLNCDGVVPCNNIANALGVDSSNFYPFPSHSYCSATGDIDGDGDLDLFVQSVGEPIALYVNNSGQNLNWLQIELLDAPPNRLAVGASARLTIAGTEQWRTVHAGISYMSASESLLSFGLSNNSTVDQIAVRWRDGTLTTLSDISANQRITIDRLSVGSELDCDRNMVADTLEITLDPSLDSDNDGKLDTCAAFSRGDTQQDGGALGIADSITILEHIFTGTTVPCLAALDVTDDSQVDLDDPIYLFVYLFLGGPTPPPPFGFCSADPTEHIDGLLCLGACP